MSVNRKRQWTDNVVRESKFKSEHDGARIDHLEPGADIPYWRYRAVVPGREPVESSDLGDLPDQLEAMAVVRTAEQ
jgi:hypothetical protein